MRAKYVLSEMMVGLWRNVTMTVAMMITMAVSLTMLGSSLVLFQQINDMKDYYFQQVQVSIFLKPDVTDDQRTALKTALDNDPAIKSEFYQSQEQAYEQFRKEFQSAKDLVDETNPSALPESYRVKLKNPERTQPIIDRYQNQPGVAEVIDQRQLLEKVFQVLGAVQKLALIIALVQGLAALLLVGNTIQVAAYSRRREVAVMKLVGASNWFIQAPFVLEAMFAGMIGAVFASLALVAGKIFLIDGSLKSLTALLTPVPWSRIYLMAPILVGVGALISGVAGWFTLRFYIRK